MKKVELKGQVVVFMGNKKELAEKAKELGIDRGDSFNVLEYDKDQNLTMLLLDDNKEEAKKTLRGLLFSHALMNVANEEISEDECVNIGFNLVNQLEELERGLVL